MVRRQLGSGLLRLVDELATVYSHGYDAGQRKINNMESPTSITAFQLQAGY